MVDGLFTILLFASCLYACFEGGKEGRWVTFFIISAAVLSIPAGSLGHQWRDVQLPVLGVDVLLLLALGIVAVRSQRYWPLWITGFHLVSIVTHIARIGQGDLPPTIYFALQSFWSVPGLLAMVAGIMMDRRAGLPKSAPWKPFRHERGAQNPG
ncbi:hypothetical protein [Allosphingosinicella vermicomposti]|uniref:hypothetical protein n=1 Tax=Allosphingosinicella vermicomposti TaxID=614671 RepID=UPI00131A4FF4|nr:hypothetical protein [Allosphingosinicella vermicomposti]